MYTLYGKLDELRPQMDRPARGWIFTSGRLLEYQVLNTIVTWDPLSNRAWHGLPLIFTATVEAGHTNLCIDHFAYTCRYGCWSMLKLSEGYCLLDHFSAHWSSLKSWLVYESLGGILRSLYLTFHHPEGVQVLRWLIYCAWLLHFYQLNVFHSKGSGILVGAPFDLKISYSSIISDSTEPLTFSTCN